MVKNGRGEGGGEGEEGGTGEAKRMAEKGREGFWKIGKQEEGVERERQGRGG